MRRLFFAPRPPFLVTPRPQLASTLKYRSTGTLGFSTL